MDGRTEGLIDRWMDGWMDGRTDGRVDAWMDEFARGCVHLCMNGLLDYEL